MLLPTIILKNVLNFLIPGKNDRRRLLILIFLWLAAVGLRADNVAFFYALDADCQALTKGARLLHSPYAIGKRQVKIYSIGDHAIYCVKMEPGIVESAISAEGLLSWKPFRVAFSVGPAGLIDEVGEPGTWYRITSIIPYESGVWSVGGFSLPEHPEKLLPMDDKNYPILPALFKTALPATVASGSAFLASATQRAKLHSATNASLVDMNLAGIGAACSNHQVPLMAWKISSDKADEHASEAFSQFSRQYQGEGGTAIAEVIRNLPPDPNSPDSYPAIQSLLRENQENDAVPKEQPSIRP